MTRTSNESFSRTHRCGIVLAAGDGLRLRPLVERLRGKALPKQYVSFVGTRSMLEHTLSRAEKLIPAQRLFTVVARNHLRHPEARRQLKSRPKGRVVVQPHNRDTLPGLLLPLLQLRRLYPDSLVAVFPSDHYVLEEDRFMRFVSLAFDGVERHPERVALLGIEPDEPEPEYGYVLPEEGFRPAASDGMAQVLRFVEKPDTRLAEDLIHRGALWNTSVLVFHTAAFLALVERKLPGFLGGFLRIEEGLGTPEENGVIEEAYRRMIPLNLSRDFLQNLAPGEPSHLSVLTARDVTWSDWGSERRILAAAHPGTAWTKGDRHERQIEVESGERHVVRGISASG
ncbi:MAG: NTP transferase domain-containing protein [Acidobacteria bacterium]|nr:NTP transferase domain-containing protein [Acidobacteriota bacterium]